jgi:hypothetical protein
MRWNMALLSHTNAVISAHNFVEAGGRLSGLVTMHLMMQQRLPEVDYAGYAFGLYLS